MKDRVAPRGTGKSGGAREPSQRTDLPKVHTSHKQHPSGIAVVAQTGSPAERTVCGTSFTHTIEGGGWAMRKLIAVGVMVGGLLAGAGMAMADPPNGPITGQGGIGDPLTLAASGALIPFITAVGNVAVVEVASPVSNNPNVHMLFYNETCARVGDSVGIPLTENDVAFRDVNTVVGVGTAGLVTIAGVDPLGFTLVPLTAPIHSRVYEFNAVDGRSTVFEPIVIDTFDYGFESTERGNGATLWSPLRTAATFFAPLDTPIVSTRLTLVCPGTNIQGKAGAAFGADTGYQGSITGVAATSNEQQGFPVIEPPFRDSVAGNIRSRIYNDTEIFLRDVTFQCNCLTVKQVGDISNVYSNKVEAPNGTYTEIEGSRVVDSTPFTGYRAVFTVGAPLNNFFGRLSNGNRDSVAGIPIEGTKKDPSNFR
jgi:hypothetical protein